MKKIHIDFQIFDSNDPKQIMVLDTSIWEHIETKPSIIEVIVPGDKDPVTMYYAKNSANILNSVNLQQNCHNCGNEMTDLPDGVYEITVKGSPDKFQKKRYYLKTTRLVGKLDDMIMKHYSECTNCDENAESISKVLRYKDLISVAESFLRKGHSCEAQSIIYKIQKFIGKSNNCRKCPHKV